MIIVFSSDWSLTLVSILRKVPPRHQSQYIGSTLDIVNSKLVQVVETPITFALGNEKVIFLHRTFQILEYEFLVLDNIVGKARYSISRDTCLP
jgi:hypothetical protein